MDEDGYAHFSAIENLAGRARVPIEDTQRAVETLLAPDSNSANPDNEGRRIERVPGGFLILNHAVHRQLGSREHQRQQTRERVTRHRAKIKQVIADSVTARYNPLQPAYAYASDSASEGKESEENKDPNSYEQHFPIKPTIEAVGKDLVFHLHARTALWFLNEKSKRYYRETSENLEPISMRLREDGVEIEAVKAMIERQVKLWQHTRMKEFLRPSTLFGKEFDTYYAARNEPISSADNAKSAPRNRGTFNESEASKYNLSAIQKNRQLQAESKPGG